MYIEGFKSNFTIIDTMLSGKSIATDIENPNTIASTGLYSVSRIAQNSTADVGDTRDGVVLITSRVDSNNNQTQEAYDFLIGRFLYRQYSNDTKTWTAWQHNPTGIRNEQIVYGDTNKTITLTTQDVFTIKDSGFYSVKSTTPNIPIAKTGSLLVMSSGDGNTT